VCVVSGMIGIRLTVR